MGCQCAKTPMDGNLNIEIHPVRNEGDVEKSKHMQDEKHLCLLDEPISISQNESSQEGSKSKGKKKRVVFQPESYNQVALQQINYARTNPGEFAKMILEATVNLHKTDDGKTVFTSGFMQKPVVEGGEEAFLAAADAMKKYNPVPPLVFKDELAMEIPENENTWTSNLLIELQEQKQAKNIIIHYGLSETLQSAENAVLLQMIEAKKRKQLMSREYKSAAITSRKGAKKMLAFYVFSKQ